MSTPNTPVDVVVVREGDGSLFDLRRPCAFIVAMTKYPSLSVFVKTAFHRKFMPDCKCKTMSQIIAFHKTRTSWSDSASVSDVHALLTECILAFLIAQPKTKLHEYVVEDEDKPVAAKFVLYSAEPNHEIHSNFALSDVRLSELLSQNEQGDHSAFRLAKDNLYGWAITAAISEYLTVVDRAQTGEATPESLVREALSDQVRMANNASSSDLALAYIADQAREMLGDSTSPPAELYDRFLNLYREANSDLSQWQSPSAIVLLKRSPVWLKDALGAIGKVIVIDEALTNVTEVTKFYVTNGISPSTAVLYHGESISDRMLEQYRSMNIFRAPLTAEMIRRCPKP